MIPPEASLRPLSASDPLAPFTVSDAILDPHIARRCRQYAAQHADLEELSKTLVDSFEGRPDIILELHKWTADFSDANVSLINAVTSACSKHEPTLMQSFDANFGVDKGQCTAAVDQVMNAPHLVPFMTTLAQRNKGTILADQIFSHLRTTAAGIPKHIYQSSGAFLQYVEEQFAVALFTNTDLSDTQLAQFYKKVAVCCTYDDCTLMLSLRLFIRLCREAKSEGMQNIYRRACQEVRKEAMHYMMTLGAGSEVIISQYVFRLFLQSEAADLGIEVDGTILNAIMTIAKGSARRRIDGEIALLRGIYGKMMGEAIAEHDAEIVESGREFEGSLEQKAWLVRVLSHPELVDKLILFAFAQSAKTYVGGNSDGGKRNLACLLLAYVSVFHTHTHEKVREHLSDEGKRRQSRERVKQVYEKLVSTAEICGMLKPGTGSQKLKGKNVQALLLVVGDGLLGRGILTWAKEGLHGGVDLRALVNTTPTHLAFLEAIVKYHPILCADILGILHRGYVRDYIGLNKEQIGAVRAAYVKTMTGLLKYNVGVQVLNTFRKQWANLAILDKSSMRRFVAGAIRTFSPPYPKAILQALNELLRHPRVKYAVASDKKLVATLSAVAKGRTPG